jgi:hypothetical protein
MLIDTNMLKGGIQLLFHPLSFGEGLFALSRTKIFICRLRSLYVVFGTIFAGIIYPIPFAVMGLAVHARLAGSTLAPIRLWQWNLQAEVDIVFASAILLAAVEAFLRARRKQTEAKIEANDEEEI